MTSTLPPQDDAQRKVRRRRVDRQLEAKRVADELDRLCNSLSPGDKIPTHTILMTQLGASQRTVLRALDDLMRVGRIVRRQKSGTIIAPIGQATPPVVPLAQASRTIVAMTRPDNAFFHHSVEVLYNLAIAAGVAVVFQPVGADAHLEPPLGNFDRALTGYLVIGSALIPLAESIASAGYRCVAIGQSVDRAEHAVPTIHTDNRLGGFLCCEHLIQLGHRRIGFAMTMDTPRWEGHQEAARESQARGIETVTEFITVETIADWTSTPGRAADYFKQPDAPTAVCAWNDDFAMQLIHILHRDGIRVPEDVSITGYDNLPIGTTFNPSITTVNNDVAHQLRAALRLLTRETPPSNNTEVIFSPSLIVRGSTGVHAGR